MLWTWQIFLPPMLRKVLEAAIQEQNMVPECHTLVLFQSSYGGMLLHCFVIQPCPGAFTLSAGLYYSLHCPGAFTVSAGLYYNQPCSGAFTVSADLYYNLTCPGAFIVSAGLYYNLPCPGAFTVSAGLYSNLPCPETI